MMGSLSGRLELGGMEVEGFTPQSGTDNRSRRSYDRCRLPLAFTCPTSPRRVVFTFSTG